MLATTLDILPNRRTIQITSANPHPTPYCQVLNLSPPAAAGYGSFLAEALSASPGLASLALALPSAPSVLRCASIFFPNKIAGPKFRIRATYFQQNCSRKHIFHLPPTLSLTCTTIHAYGCVDGGVMPFERVRTPTCRCESDEAVWLSLLAGRSLHTPVR